MSLHFLILQHNPVLICLTSSSLKASVNIWKVSGAVLPNLKQNLMHMHCSLKSVIFWRHKNCTGHNTLSHFIETHATTLTATTNNHAGSTPPHLDDKSSVLTPVVLWLGGYDSQQPNTLMEGSQCSPIWEATYGDGEMPLRTNTMRHIPIHWHLYILYPVPPQLNTVHHKWFS
jgi:hypothetical protein